MIPKIQFGSTGYESSRVIFGAAALYASTEQDSERALELLLAHGINHIDVAASYGDAEIRVGGWMDRHRDDFFLATKTGERGYAAAREQIHRSLERLRVDCIDLIQFHNLVKPDEWDAVFSDDGALRAAVEARDEGLLRFIGVTGHGTRVAAMHLASLGRFEFDSVLLPLNYLQLENATYRAEFEQLRSLCAERGVAVQTIKSIARRRWPEDAVQPYSTWYEPLSEQADIDRAIAWAVSHEGVFINTASDVTLLERSLHAAERAFEHPADVPTDAQMSAMVDAFAMLPIFVRGAEGARTM